MTIALAVKVFDGLVLAADSAEVIELPSGTHQVYNNADKLFRLHRDKPIGALTWGFGNINGSTVSGIAKDLRDRFMGLDPDRSDWKLADDYTVRRCA